MCLDLEIVFNHGLQHLLFWVQLCYLSMTPFYRIGQLLVRQIYQLKELLMSSFNLGI